MQLYLTPAAIGYLTQLILAALISGYFLLLVRRQHSQRTLWLLGFFTTITAFLATLFLEAAFAPTQRLTVVFLQNALLAVAMTCLLQFAHHFPTLPTALHREARLALLLSSLYALWETGYAVFRFVQLRAGVIEYRPNWSDYLLLLFLLWAPVSFFRQMYLLAPAAGNLWARLTAPLRRSPTRDARAAWGFALIFLFVAGLSVFNILRGAHLLSVALANMGISLGMLIALFSFAVTYLNYRPETTSFMVKLVGVTLMVVLAIMGVVGWVVSLRYEELYHPVLPDQRTLRFTSNEAGGYTIIQVPFAFAPERGRKLPLTDDTAHTCSRALDFEFPFYGQVYSQVYVCNDGAVSFRQGMEYRMYQYRYGAGVPLILPLLTDLYPEISSGGVFVQQEAERLIITWERQRGFKQQESEFTFQAILYPNGVFDFNYNGLPEHRSYHPNDDPGANVWAIGALPGGLERRTGPQLVTLTDLPLNTGPDGVLQDYHLKFRQHLHQLFAPLAGLILIASVLIVVGFPLLFRFTLVHPLNALLRGVQRIEAGDYSSHVPVQYPDEIGFLTRAFNRLAVELGDLIQNLEARVAARTQALNAANTHLRAEIAEREQAQATLIEQQRALATFEERERLGRELHDGLGQVLGYINVQAQTVKTMLAAGQTLPAQANLQRIVQAAQKTHADIRNFILGLHTEDIPRQDFLETLRDYLCQFQTTYGIETRLSLPDGTPLPEFGPAVEGQLLRIIQEALTNVRKHAAARRVQVLFNFTATATHIIIADDGIGFQPPPFPPMGEPALSLSKGTEGEEFIPMGGTEGGTHFGLTMMRERAEAVGGQVEIRSAPEQGACVLIHVPRLVTASGGDAEIADLAGLRLLLVDDHPLFLEGLRSLLTARGFTVVGVARDGEAALQQTRTLRPDVVVMDMHMPGGGGLEATRAIKAELPETKIVMLTVAEDDAHLFEAIESGASGYLLKSLDATQFCALLTGLLRDEAPLATGMAARIMAEFSRRDTVGVDLVPTQARLTSRQEEILGLVAQGLIYKEIAQRLHLSEKTIKYHMGQILERLHVENRAQAIAYYHQLQQK